MSYKRNLERIRELILEMATSPEDDLEYKEYATLATEAYDLSHYLDSVAESLAMASSVECTAALAALLDNFINGTKPKSDPVSPSRKGTEQVSAVPRPRTQEQNISRSKPMQEHRSSLAKKANEPLSDFDKNYQW